MDLLTQATGVFGGMTVKDYNGGVMQDGSTLEPGTSVRVLILFPESMDWEVFKVPAEFHRSVATVTAGCEPGTTPVVIEFDAKRYGSQPFKLHKITLAAKAASK